MINIGLGLGLPFKARSALLPSLSLGFTNTNTLDPRITFTRASSGTHFDSTGRLVTDGNNVARFDYDPAVAAGVTGGELGGNTLGIAPWNTSPGSGSITGGVWTGMAQFGLEGFATNLTVGKRYRANGTATVSGGACGLYSSAGTFYGSITSSFDFTFVAVNPTFSLQANSASMTIALTSFSLQEIVYTPRGLLIEEQRTNLLLHSRDMTQAAWSKTDVTAARTQVGIDGVASSACLMTEGSAGTASSVQNGTVAAGSTVAESFVLKRGNTDWVRIRLTEPTGADGVDAYFNLNTGVKGQVIARGAGTSNNSTITSLGGGWHRCTVTTLPNGSYTSAQAFLASAAGDGNGTRVANATYIVDCAQLEVGAFATSPIITGAATATRAADSASMTGTNFSSWFNATQGTFVVEGDTSDATGYNECFVSVDDGTSNNRIQIRRNSDNNYSYLFVNTGGVAQTTLTSANNSWMPGVVGKTAAAYATDDFAFSFAGSAASTDTLGTLPVVNRVVLGSGLNSNALNGHIRSLRFYNQRLGNSTLTALTA